MVVHASDSCNTLISLDQNTKKRLERYDCRQSGHQEHHYQQTELLLPEDGADDDLLLNGDDVSLAQMVGQRLYLPVNVEEEAVDMFLRSIPQLVQRVDELLATPARVLDATCTTERILYVGQGELGHATPAQCDVIASDKATTCHFLAVRSILDDRSEPLVSLTHLDAPMYQECLRNLIREHKDHHFYKDGNFQDEKKKECSSTTCAVRIRMEMHVLGGFEDETSRNISNYLLPLLAQIALEERDSIRIVLQTCAVSSLNDTGHSAPIGRGIGIDTRTGQVFLAKVSDNCVGPSPALRSVRLWSGGDAPKRLTIIHTSRSDDFIIEPFAFEAFREIDVLLTLPDTIMREYISTSPLVEEDDFCHKIRRSLLFLKNHTSQEIFQYSRPILYRRSACNEWKRVR